MEGSNEESIQFTDEPKSSNDTQLTEIEATSISLLTSTNDETKEQPPTNEEEEKPNNDQNASNDAELKSISSSGSKTGSKNVSAKLTPRSGSPSAVKQDVRAYLEEKVFPVLTNGLEELLKAVDDRNKKLNEEEEEEIPEINPLLFLARYLMRNAPHSSSNSSRASSQHSQDRNSNQNNDSSKDVPAVANEEVTDLEKSEEEKPTEM